MPGGSKVFWVLTCLLLATALWAEEASTPPASKSPMPLLPKAKIDPVTDDVQGHKIVDNYRWLENGDSPETQEFERDELAYTRSILDPLPGREAIFSRLKELSRIGLINAPQLGGNYYFYTRREGAQNQPLLYVREGVHGKDRVLVDPNTMAADSSVALDWWFPSDDGKYLAYGVSPGGSEESVLHLIETATGRLLPDTIDRMPYGSISWKKDNSGFYYNRHPKKGDVPAGEEVYHYKVFYHALGADCAADRLIFDPLAQGKEYTPQDTPFAQLPDDDDRWLGIYLSQGFAKNALYLQDLKAETPAVEITTGKDFLYSAEIFRGKLYITTNEDAPRYRLFVVDASSPKRENWKEIIPQSDAVLQNVGVIGGKLVALYQKNAISQMKAFELDGKPLGEIALPGIGTVAGLGGRWDHKEMFYGFQSFTVPASVYQVDVDSRQSSLWDRVHAPIDPSNYQSQQVWFTSKDGTKVPMFLFHKKGITLDGKNPTLLTGYGGFNVSLTPSFMASRFVWLDHGGVFAVANLRGGAEFGEDWHRAGMLANKQNVFDDFIAAAEFLISDHVTDKEHLVIQGGSNGGLLMGAALTQRPDLFRVVICQVPLLDMLRYQNFRIAKLWIPEYGSADDPKQFDWLYAYSPYHHVKPGALYPAILFTSADTDMRVDPMHAKKMTALMQAEAANGQSRERPILLRIKPKGGHGAVAGEPVDKQIEESTDIYSFVFWQLGVRP